MTPSDPKTLDELLELMKANDDSLGDWTDLPTFGGTYIHDPTGIWSWDELRVLVGTCSGDVRIRPRDEEFVMGLLASEEMAAQVRVDWSRFPIAAHDPNDDDDDNMWIRRGWMPEGTPVVISYILGPDEYDGVHTSSGYRLFPKVGRAVWCASNVHDVEVAV